MRIVFVAPWVPSPIRVRSYGILQLLLQKHEVWLVCAVSEGESTDHLEHLGLAGVTAVRRNRMASVVRAAKGLLTGESLQVALLAEPELLRAIAHISRE